MVCCGFFRVKLVISFYNFPIAGITLTVMLNTAVMKLPNAFSEFCSPYLLGTVDELIVENRFPFNLVKSYFYSVSCLYALKKFTRYIIISQVKYVFKMPLYRISKAYLFPEVFNGPHASVTAHFLQHVIVPNIYPAKFTK